MPEPHLASAPADVDEMENGDNGEAAISTVLIIVTISNVKVASAGDIFSRGETSSLLTCIKDTDQYRAEASLCTAATHDPRLTHTVYQPGRKSSCPS